MLKTINPPSGGACVLCRCRYAFVQEIRLLWPVCTNLPDFRRLSLHPSDAVRATEQTGGRPDRIFRILTMGKGRNDFRSSKEKKKVFPLSGMQKTTVSYGRFTVYSRSNATGRRLLPTHRTSSSVSYPLSRHRKSETKQNTCSLHSFE